jgi:hypothetical protein
MDEISPPSAPNAMGEVIAMKARRAPQNLAKKHGCIVPSRVKTDRVGFRFENEGCFTLVYCQNGVNEDG